MSISNAMQTGVSGLLANSASVGNISSNIANANTDGYRRSFSQMVTSASSSGNVSPGSASVLAVTKNEISVEGATRSTDSDSDLAISGNGFFVVSRSANETSASNYYLTRAGSFTVDDEGNLVNAAGYYLAGYAYNSDGSLGNVDRTTTSDLVTVNVANTSIVGQASTEMSLSGNLASELTGTGADTGTSYTSSLSFYNSLGAEEKVSVSWTPTTTDNVWTMELSYDGQSLGTVDVTFSDSSGTAGTPLSYTNVTSNATAPAAFAFDTATGVASVTVANGTTPQSLTISVGSIGESDGITQFSGGDQTVSADVDGYASGTMTRFEIDESGDLYGIFDNGSRRLLYNIPLAVVTNPDGLAMVNGNAYITTASSGNFNLQQANSGTAGTIESGALESSNVELAEELTQLIQTQRAYSSNAKIITTVDEMMDETTNLKR
ncbi:flagellar hook protein FlgE [Albibacillus kandeliae]|uniref:flagellar hook protein FlgE n=1 Tax=Albibacillus kandeliae TaxID=2174228 RepID=UPI000D68D455|nr:flagellar hook protein FlgE [Albibacillus kandeliae]